VLTLLTATGCRPKAWALCERWMMAQTYQGPVHWIVVDDGEEPQPVTFSRKGWTITFVRPTPTWKPGQNTQARNLLAGLDMVHSADRLLVIEDDDYYAPRWLERAAKALELAELVGECRARYYNLATRTGRQLSNSAHASLCSTAMRGSAIEAFRAVCKPGVKFIDLSLWKAHPSKYLFTGGDVVGIKGLPGRGGIGMGHRADMAGTKDKDGALLRQWVGSDAHFYQ
jgi:hypothetical protein